MGRPRDRARRRVRARLEQGSARVTGSREERVNLAWPDGCTPRSSAESPATAGFSRRWGVGCRGDGRTSPHPGESPAIALTWPVVAQRLGFEPRSGRGLDSREVRVATPPAGSSRPGVTVGPTSEFSLFFRVKPGEGPSLAAALRDLQDTPGYRPGDYGMAVSTIHEARFVLFDDDTRLAFITSFDGPWDAYMVDFFSSGPTLALFDVIFRHVEGYDGLPDMAALQAFILEAQQTAGRVCTQLRRHGEGGAEGAEGQQGLPAGARPSRCGGGIGAPGVEAVAGRGRRLARRIGDAESEDFMSDHISGPRALADPIADITDVYAFPSPESPGRLVLVMNTLPFAKPFDAFSEGLVYRFRLRPLSAGEADDPAPFVPGAEEFVFDCVFSPHTHAGGEERVEQEGTCTTPGGETVGFRVNDVAGGAGHGVRVFAGVRWDPFMMDAPAALENDRDREAGVHRSELDLPRRQERPQSRRRDRLRAAGRRRAGRRRRRDADTRDVQRPDRARRAARGEEHDAGTEAVRPGESRSRDPGPVQHGGRVSARGGLRRAPTARGSTPTSPSGMAWTGRPTGPRTRTAVIR